MRLNTNFRACISLVIMASVERVTDAKKSAATGMTNLSFLAKRTPTKAKTPTIGVKRKTANDLSTLTTTKDETKKFISVRNPEKLVKRIKLEGKPAVYLDKNESKSDNTAKAAKTAKTAKVAKTSKENGSNDEKVVKAKAKSKQDLENLNLKRQKMEQDKQQRQLLHLRQKKSQAGVKKPTELEIKLEQTLKRVESFKASVFELVWPLVETEKDKDGANNGELFKFKIRNNRKIFKFQQNHGQIDSASHFDKWFSRVNTILSRVTDNDNELLVQLKLTYFDQVVVHCESAVKKFAQVSSTKNLDLQIQTLKTSECNDDRKDRKDQKDNKRQLAAIKKLEKIKVIAHSYETAAEHSEAKNESRMELLELSHTKPISAIYDTCLKKTIKTVESRKQKELTKTANAKKAACEKQKRHDEFVDSNNTKEFHKWIDSINSFFEPNGTPIVELAEADRLRLETIKNSANGQALLRSAKCRWMLYIDRQCQQCQKCQQSEPKLSLPPPAKQVGETIISPLKYNTDLSLDFILSAQSNSAKPVNRDPLLDYD